MHTLKLSLAEGCQVQLQLADFNRLRWAVYALQSSHELRQSFQRNESVFVYDSICLAAQEIQPATDAYIILWDGLNSHIELCKRRTELLQRTDLRYLVVGSFPEVTRDLPAHSQALFPRRNALIHAPVSLPWQFRAKRSGKTAARPVKNAVFDLARHFKLASSKNVVFCGLVRPTPAVISNLLTNRKLQSLREPVRRLGNVHWNEAPQKVSAQVQLIYEKCRNLDAGSAEDFVGIYSLLNICSRMAVISQLHAAGCRVFISEYGFQKNFDAYDTYAYGDNTFLDFGSSRGACHWYPRTMDMRATGKKFIALRVIQEDQSLSDYLSSHSATDYAAQLGIDAAHVLEQLG
jgi:hypothetical protein